MKVCLRNWVDCILVIILIGNFAFWFFLLAGCTVNFHVGESITTNPQPIVVPESRFNSSIDSGIYRGEHL